MPSNRIWVVIPSVFINKAVKYAKQFATSDHFSG